MPLAERLRPHTLEEMVGHARVIGEHGIVRRMIEQGTVRSLILWGPPGCGKTTLARVIARASQAHLVMVSAVTTGAAELRGIFDTAHQCQKNGEKTILLLDEIHRLNRVQQDMLLPHTESGQIVLIGATTENPSFSLSNALLSRCQVLTLELLDAAAMSALLARVEASLATALPLTADARDTLIALAAGDGRALISAAEQLHLLSTEGEEPLSSDRLLALLEKHRPLYDKHGDGHYMLISALHKSIRGSDVDAALYWMARMFEGGEDRHYLLRRLIRMASEDIGLADPTALTQALAAAEAYERLGSPEGELAIAQAVIALATAPKSNAVYTAFHASLALAKSHSHLSPPPHAINAPTDWMEAQGYGAGYRYDHDTKEGCAGQNYFPEAVPRTTLYRPVERGYERDVLKRVRYFNGLRGTPSS